MNRENYLCATRLLGLHPENPVLIHPDDAKRFHLEMGDLVEISTPGGSLKARIMVHAGITPGVAAIEHGFGHRELGARAHRIGRMEQPKDKRLAAGVNLNDIGLLDPTRPDNSPWVDAISGASVAMVCRLKCSGPERPQLVEGARVGPQHQAGQFGG